MRLAWQKKLHMPDHVVHTSCFPHNLCGTKKCCELHRIIIIQHAWRATMTGKEERSKLFSLNNGLEGETKRPKDLSLIYNFHLQRPPVLSSPGHLGKHKLQSRPMLHLILTVQLVYRNLLRKLKSNKLFVQNWKF